MKKVRLIELFAGYGSQAMALRNIDTEPIPGTQLDINDFL